MTAVVTGLGVYAPERVVPNSELVATLDTTDEWIRSRTGIAQRHVADPGVATGDLATEAGARALKSSGQASVDAVVVATMTPDRTCPATAPVVAARLGLPPGMAFDLNAACSGFLYGLAVASSMVSSGLVERVLVIGADVMTRTVDPSDRNTSVLFGDGAGAVVVTVGDVDAPGAIGPFDLGSDGDGAELLHIPAGGSLVPADAATVAAGDHYLRMDGKAVYRHAVSRMADSCRRLLDSVGLALTDVDRLVAHQANARIVTAVADRLGFPAERCVCNVDRYGNTTAASIPLALDDLRAAGALPGERVLLTAFGAGLSWGSALLRWPDLGER